MDAEFAVAAARLGANYESGGSDSCVAPFLVTDSGGDGGAVDSGGSDDSGGDGDAVKMAVEVLYADGCNFAAARCAASHVGASQSVGTVLGAAPGTKFWKSKQGGLLGKLQNWDGGQN